MVKISQNFGQNLANLDQILDFLRSNVFFRKERLRFELSTPKYIYLAIKHVFLGLKRPILGQTSQIAPLAPLWRLGAANGRQNWSIWHFLIRQSSNYTFGQALTKYEKIDNFNWKNCLYRMPSVHPTLSASFVPWFLSN